MSVVFSASPPSLEPPRAAAPPVKPEPWDIAQWRREWAAWWSVANRLVVRQVIPEAR